MLDFFLNFFQGIKELFTKSTVTQNISNIHLNVSDINNQINSTIVTTSSGVASTNSIDNDYITDFLADIEYLKRSGDEILVCFGKDKYNLNEL